MRAFSTSLLRGSCPRGKVPSCKHTLRLPESPQSDCEMKDERGREGKGKRIRRKGSSKGGKAGEDRGKDRGRDGRRAKGTFKKY